MVTKTLAHSEKEMKIPTLLYSGLATFQTHHNHWMASQPCRRYGFLLRISQEKQRSWKDSRRALAHSPDYRPFSLTSHLKTLAFPHSPQKEHLLTIPAQVLGHDEHNCYGLGLSDAALTFLPWQRQCMCSSAIMPCFSGWCLPHPQTREPPSVASQPQKM